MKRKRHQLLIGSAFALGVAVLGLLGAGVRLVLDPPPQRCPLPVLPVSTPVADFSWSPDGKRLLGASRAGEVWIVHFPEQRVQRLPRFPQPASRTGWDRQAAPWLVYADGLARLRADGRGWDRFPVSAAPVVSPGGRWVAELPAPRPSQTSRRRGGPLVVVRAARPQPSRREAWFASSPTNRYAWLDPETLLVHRRGAWLPTPQLFRPDNGRLLELCPDPSPKTPYVNYEVRSGPGETIYHWLLTRDIPGFPWRRYQDCDVTVTDGAGRVLHRAPVGRWHYGPGSSFWQSAKLSPDRKYVVLRAADGSLRVINLRAPRP